MTNEKSPPPADKLRVTGTVPRDRHESLMDSQYRAGAMAGWNAAQLPEAEAAEKIAQLIKVEAGDLAALRQAAPAEHVAPSEAELMRQKAISNARERNAAERAVQAALDDFELTVERIDAGQIDRARGTAFQGAKEARRFLATATEGSGE